MDDFTLNDLLAILRASGGDVPPDRAGDELMDVPLADLGYDSLAVLDAFGRISRRFGVALSDDVVTELRTSRAVIEYVNQRRSAEV